MASSYPLVRAAISQRYLGTDDFSKPARWENNGIELTPKVLFLMGLLSTAEGALYGPVRWVETLYIISFQKNRNTRTRKNITAFGYLECNLVALPWKSVCGSLTWGSWTCGRRTLRR